jgi:hypothetical protein
MAAPIDNFEQEASLPLLGKSQKLSRSYFKMKKPFARVERA